MPPVKGFDAVEESRRVKRLIADETRDMSFEELRAYFQKGIEEMYGKKSTERSVRRAAARKPALAFA